MKTAILPLLLLLALVSACAGTGSKSTSEAQAATPSTPIVVDTARVETRKLQRSVEAVGTLDPNEEVTLSNQVEGIVEKLFVDLGDGVRTGQVIAVLDTRELELAVHQQQAALQQELARLGLDEENALVDEATTSQVRQAEATFAEAKIRLHRTEACSRRRSIQATARSAASSIRCRRGRCSLFARNCAQHSRDDLGSKRRPQPSRKETRGCQDHRSDSWLRQKRGKPRKGSF